jgi:hypothetical protein
MRKLMGRFGTREMEVDNLLRNEVFVDLYLGAAGSESWRWVEWCVWCSMFRCFGVTEPQLIADFCLGEVAIVGLPPLVVKASGLIV